LNTHHVEENKAHFKEIICLKQGHQQPLRNHLLLRIIMQLYISKNSIIPSEVILEAYALWICTLQQCIWNVVGQSMIILLQISR